MYNFNVTMRLTNKLLQKICIRGWPKNANFRILWSLRLALPNADLKYVGCLCLPDAS